MDLFTALGFELVRPEDRVEREHTASIRREREGARPLSPRGSMNDLGPSPDGADVRCAVGGTHREARPVSRHGEAGNLERKLELFVQRPGVDPMNEHLA
jgi:hypothetical protein